VKAIQETILCSALLLLAALPALAGFAERVDITHVLTFDEEFINWATPVVREFQFPTHPEIYDEALLYLTIGCPESPGDCDPWDRLGHLRIIQIDPSDSTEIHYEIARFITPYDITPSPPYPGTCTWVLDVTDYKFLLAGDVTLRLYIESWIGGNRGWLMTCDFAFIHGVSELQPYKIVNLWTRDWLEYGNPDNPIEAALAPIEVEIPAEAAAAKVRATTTAHGQGNTSNCAEFCPRHHSVVAGPETFEHLLWRNDCSTNECSPQGGTWQYSRAGWCPGDKVDPWDNEITHLITPGAPITLDYNVDEYFNQCGPHNPDCVSGQTCTDCNYNNTGHTMPGYNVNAQLILYRVDLTEAPGEPATVPGLKLGRNFPNPFNPTTTFSYQLAEPGAVTLRIYSAGGRLLREVRREHASGGAYWYRWDGMDESGETLASGIYFYEVTAAGVRQARKMLMLQ
jgi:hypothetical protein